VLGRPPRRCRRSRSVAAEYPLGQKIYIDLNALDGDTVVHKQFGTIRDLVNLDIEIVEGMKLPFYADDADEDGRPDDILVDGHVTFENETGHLVAVLDLTSFRHEI
jgi:hypothetical protein